MKSYQIFDENGKGYTRVFSMENIEKVNPIDYFREYEFFKRKLLYRDILRSSNPGLNALISDDFLERYILNEDFEGFFEQFFDKELSEKFIKILDTPRKKDQLLLLKGLDLTPKKLHTWIIRAFKERGFLFSRYLFEILPKGLEGKKLPQLVRLKDGETIEKSGETELSEGELKNLIKHRKVIIANFLENGEVWHCIFSTYKGLFGEENYKNGQPHFHYISSSFGVKRDDFINSLESGDYKSTSVHVDLFGYRDDEKS